jgi:hypothetical protein
MCFDINFSSLFADITFNASHPANWLDPDNWCPTDSEEGSCQPMALLDSERIPCQTDHVIFPTGSSYYVNLGTNLNIKVNTLKVSGKVSLRFVKLISPKVHVLDRI